ncbi:MAG TPA: cyclic pyranopterin monophosphate synthase MoaC [Caulobacteraceae bacterium]|nr:cyclic pyranopterin monophosphate synthase MoaC [Caulobacteraceae bacterium]
MSELSHIDQDGRARMVDVSAKPETARVAWAEGFLVCKTSTLDAALAGTTPKGAVISTAELAGVMAAKKTSDLIPLCHPLPLSKIEVAIAPDHALPGFRVRAEARTMARTGVEMEALTAVSVACLTLYDMLKAIDRSMSITGVRVLAKSGGRSGDWSAEAP